MERAEADRIFESGREGVVEALQRMDLRIQTLSERLLPFARRSARDRRLTAEAAGHVDFYRAVMRDDVSRSAEAAVGSETHEDWLASGRVQFEYLLEHGLEPSNRVLEIGCGNLRAGRLIIDFLEPGRYHGVDISPEILLAALDSVARFGLQAKLPRLTLVRDLELSFLPDGCFDVIHAHSVFSHSPIEVVDECLRSVGRLLAPGGFFDFTYNATEGDERDVLREDFFYRTETLVKLAARHGLRATPMDDWEGRNKQSKLRVTA